MVLTCALQPRRPAGSDSNLACRAARRYVELTDSGQYDKVGTLFANDAIYFGPNEEAMQGAAKIGAFYTIFLSHAKPHVQMASMVPAGPHDCFIELQGTTSGKSAPRDFNGLRGDCQAASHRPVGQEYARAAST